MLLSGTVSYGMQGNRAHIDSHKNFMRAGVKEYRDKGKTVEETIKHLKQYSLLHYQKSSSAQQATKEIIKELEEEQLSSQKRPVKDLRIDLGAEDIKRKRIKNIKSQLQARINKKLGKDATIQKKRAFLDK